MLETKLSDLGGKAFLYKQIDMVQVFMVGKEKDFQRIKGLFRSPARSPPVPCQLHCCRGLAGTALAYKKQWDTGFINFSVCPMELFASIHNSWTSLLNKYWGIHSFQAII